MSMRLDYLPCWFLEGSSIDHVCSVAAVLRSSEVDWTSFSSLDTWFSYSWEAGKVLDLAEGEGNTMLLRKSFLGGDVPQAHQALPAGVVGIAVGWLASMDEACTRDFGSDSLLGLASYAGDGHLCDHELVPYPDIDNGNNWVFPDLPVDSHYAVRGSLRREFDAICEFCSFANVAVPEDASGNFRLAFQNLNAIVKRISALSSKAAAPERFPVVEGTAGTSLAGWTFEMIDMVCERDNSRITVEILNTYLLPVCK